MATQNRWALGEMYGNGYVNGQPFFTQPGGPGTAVFPTEQNGQPWEAWPAAGVIPFIETGGAWFRPGCQHSIHYWKIIREFDYDTGLSVALVVCSTCQYVQSAQYEPFDTWYLPTPSNSNIIIIG